MARGAGIPGIRRRLEHRPGANLHQASNAHRCNAQGMSASSATSLVQDTVRSKEYEPRATGGKRAVSVVHYGVTILAYSVEVASGPQISWPPDLLEG
jgi:hypothetical protein